MSRSGYSEDCDNNWLRIMWRGRVASSIRGKRGQKLLRDMLAAFDAMPVKELILGELESEGSFCALGAVGHARGIDMAGIDPDDTRTVAATFDIAAPLATEIVYQNDEAKWGAEAPSERFDRMRAWVVSQIKGVQP